MDEFPSNLPSTFMLLYCSGHSVHFPLTNLNLIGRSPIYFIHFFPGGGNFFLFRAALLCLVMFKLLAELQDFNSRRSKRAAIMF